MDDRGQMIMACGTGKTLTSLRIAEEMVGKGGLVLYAVPSISLMRQTIRYWAEQKVVPHSYVGVCSDPKVSHGEKTDVPLNEMEIPVTTDPERISAGTQAGSRLDDRGLLHVPQHGRGRTRPETYWCIL